MDDKISYRNQPDDSPICVVPYVPGVSPSLKTYLSKEGFRVYYSYKNKLGNILYTRFYGSNSKRNCIFDSQGVVYQISCKNCNKVYIGKTKRFLISRYKEHLANATKQHRVCGLAEHVLDFNHSFDKECVSILCRDSSANGLSLKEAIFIRSQLGHTVNSQSDMEYSRHISHGWDPLLPFL